MTLEQLEVSQLNIKHTVDKHILLFVLRIQHSILLTHYKTVTFLHFITFTYGAMAFLPTVSSPGHRSIDGSADLLSKEKNEEGNGGMGEKAQEWKDCMKHIKNIGEDGERNEEQQRNREEVRGEDVKEGTLTAQTTDRVDRREDNQGSAEDAADPKQPETEAKDRAEREGVEKRGEAETQIPVQTTTDTTTEKSDTQPVIDFIVSACEPSDCSQSLSQKVTEKNEGYEITRVHAFCSDEHQSVNHGPNSVIQEVQRLSHDEVQTFAESVTQMPSPVYTEEKPPNKPATDILTELSGPLNQSDAVVSIQELETTETQPSDLSDNPSHLKQTDDDVKEDVLVRKMIETPQSQEISEQIGQLKSDEDGDSSAYKKREGQTNVDTGEKDACETSQDPLGKSNLKAADIPMDTADSLVETGSCQDHMKNDKAEDAGDAKTTDLKLSVHPSHESDASPETDNTKSYELKKSPAEEMLLDGTNELSLLSNKTHRLSFDLGSTQRKAVTPRTTSDVSILHQFVQVLQF